MEQFTEPNKINEVVESPSVVENEAKELWARCLALLSTKLSSQTFKSWFEPIKPVSYSSNQLILQVPSNFFHEWIEDQYSSILDEVKNEVLGVDCAIKFKVNSDGFDIITESNVKTEPEIKVQNISPNRDDIKILSKPYKPGLNDKNTFENFVNGESNQLARAAAYAVANNPGGTQFNPLVIYGDVGLGKTHLIQAIGNHALKTGKAKRVIYVTSEIFTLEFVDAIQKDKVNEFSNFYRSMDILIVDDIQFFEGKDKTQDNFFHTFNTLYQLGKQIVLSSDKPPKELKGLNERLISRFQSGLTADIQPPDLEMRVAILKKKSQQYKLEIPQDIIEFIAVNVTSNIRQLEGCLHSLIAISSLKNLPISMEIAKEVVRQVVGEIKTHITIEDIQRIVCQYFDIPENYIRAKNRKQEVVIARQYAMYLCKEITNSSLKTIGLHFGGRDHSTVIHAIQTIEDLVKSDQKYADILQTLRNKIKLVAK
ncbi:MAG: Chromosomal replication initiator protein DnaA [Ignavibacteriae bacterium]|nr:MAG: Chromosomal replication initiator protein DnaA [Ignavibacteriota bacterium]